MCGRYSLDLSSSKSNFKPETIKEYSNIFEYSNDNISPSLEPSHAFAEAIKIAPKLKSSEIIIVNSCGDSLKDKDIIKQRLGSYLR